MSTLDKFNSNIIIRNKNYETDLKYDLELYRILLKSIGVWPADTMRLTNFDRIIVAVAKWVTIFLLLFLMIPIGSHLVFVEKNWSVKIQVLVTVNYCFEALVKYVLVIARSGEIKSCINMIAADWREVDWAVYRSIMIEKARSCRVFTVLFVACNYGGIIIYHLIVPFVPGGSYPLGENNTNPAPILYGTEFFIFDSRLSPMCEIVYLGQTLAAAAMCTVNCGICTIAVKFSMHACCRYQNVIELFHIIDDIENGDDNADKCQAEKRRRFNRVIRRHLYASEFVPQIERALNGVCFVSLAISTINICCLGYTLVAEWEHIERSAITSYVMGMMCTLLNMFVLCYSGEKLAEKCREVGVAGYMTNWWGMQLNESRALILMIAASQLPIEFTAGKMFDLSLNTFVAVVKVAMSYLNFLRTMIQYHE